MPMKLGIIAAYVRGEPSTSISARIGMSSSGVRKILWQAGVKMRTLYKTTPEMRRDIVEDYRSGLSSVKCAKKYGLTPKAVFDLLKKVGFPSRKNEDYVGREVFQGYCPASVREEMTTMYSRGKSSPAIARQFKITAGGVIRILRRRGTTIRRPGDWRFRKLDESVFETAEGESAYWIGMMLTDGWVHQHKSQSPAVGLGLKTSDKAHVEMFRDFLKTDAPVYFKPPPRKPSVLNGNLIRGSGSWCVQVYSRRLAADLHRWGVTQRKTKTAAVHPDLLSNRDTWRGIADGDGCLYWWRYRGIVVPGFNVVGTLKVATAFRDYVGRVCGSVNCRPVKLPGMWATRTVGHRAAMMTRLLYRPGDVCLERKRLMAEGFAKTHYGITLPIPTGRFVSQLAASSSR